MRESVLATLLFTVSTAQNLTNFTPPERLDVGINLSPLATDGWGVQEWTVTSTRVFRDLFKHATDWAIERAAFDGGVQAETWKRYGLEPVNMTFANGYPWHLPRWYRWNDRWERQSVVAYIGWGGGHVAPGQYAIHYDGNGTITVGGDATMADVAGCSFDVAAMRGRCVFNVSSARDGVEVRITYTDPLMPLHRVRIYRVADEVLANDGTVDVTATDVAIDAAPFHPELLLALNGVRLLRFCGWARVDGNDYNGNNFLPAWFDRATPASLTQAGTRGVALEYMVCTCACACFMCMCMVACTRPWVLTCACAEQVGLANTLNASAWFCMPRSDAMKSSSMTSPNRPGEAAQADLEAYAGYVHANLLPHLTAFVECARGRRQAQAPPFNLDSCCCACVLALTRVYASADRADAVSNAEAPQTHAIESLEIWRAWSTAFGADASQPAQLGTRLVRVSAAGAWLSGTLTRFGTDIGAVDAVALRASFGRLCVWGTRSTYNECVEFHDRERGAEFYAEWSVEELLDKVQEAALHAEAELNAQVQLLHQRGLRLVSDVGGPHIFAADYGARATLHGTHLCEQCLRTRLGNKYGSQEFAALSASSESGGYVKASQWHQLLGYQGIAVAARALVTTDESGAASYWRHVGADVASCVTICDSSALCAGFAHQRTREWSCGVTYHNDCPGATEGFNGGNQCYERYGGCAVPGTCYFFNNRTYSQHGTRGIQPDEWDGTYGVQLRDVYWKGTGTPGSAPHLIDETEAGAQCQSSCQSMYRGDAKAQAESDAAGWTLDVLSANRSQYEAAAALEQRLEDKLLEVNAHPRMADIFLDFLDRWRRIGGSLFVAQPLYRPPVRCETGGKACGHEALMLGPADFNSSKLRAVTGYNLGLRSALPSTAAEARDQGLETFPPPCAPPCQWGTCVRGACSCYLGVEGIACDRISGAAQPNTCTNDDAPLGINLAGISDYSRQWAYVDVFKSARNWCHMLYGDYNCRDDIEPALEIDPSNGGFPVRLAPGHRACALMVRDLEAHYLSGVYTVLYEGDGTLEFGLDSDYVKRIRPGLIEVDVTLTTDVNNGIYLCITRQNERDPLRRIRVMTPGHVASGALENAEPEFHPAFVHTLRRYKALRFMDWAAANDEEAAVVHWADRAHEGDAATKHSYAIGPAVPYESMVRLSNMLGAEPWLTIPHNASDDYCLQLARLLNATLRPDLGVTISLSNEMWHSGFIGGQFAELMGHTTGLGRHCWYVGRTVAIAQIMRPVLANDQARTVSFVVESQASNVPVTSVVIDCLAGNHADIDAIAIAPYFDGYDPLLPNLASVLASYELAVNASLDLVREHYDLASQAGYKLFLYEAGPDGKGNATVQDLSIAAHRDPQMRDLVRRYYRGMKDIGVELLMHFSSVGTPSIYGNFGTIESTDQDPSTAPKQQGLYDFIEDHATCDVDAMRDETCAAPSVCAGRGHCLAPELRTWGVRPSQECSCFFASSGVDCATFTPVEYRSCGYRCTFDQGVCAVADTYGPNQYWACTECHPDHFGATCSRFRCSNDCNGHGHCLDANVCSCLRGYAGDGCEHDCGCSGHGQCNSDGGCICDVGWRLRSDGQPGCEWDCETVDVPGLGCIGPGQRACGTQACIHGTCVDGICRCWAGYTGATCSEPTERPNAGSTFGLNLHGGAGTNWMFVDLMKESRGWVSINDADRFAGQFSYQDGGNSLVFTNRQYQWGNGVPMNLSSTDYPLEVQETQALITLMARDVCKHAVDGRYVLLYEGDGEIDLGMDARAVAFQSGRIDFDFTPTCNPSCWFDRAEWRPYCTDNGIALTVRRTNPADPVRSIKVIAPGFLATHEHLPFHPWFMRQLTRYSTLRFMDWARTNEIPLGAISSLQNVAALRFNATKLRGPSPACGGLMGDFYVFYKGSPVPIASASDANTGRAMPEVIDGSEWTGDCAQAGANGEASMLFTLAAPTMIDAYAWRTSHRNSPESDPVRWLIEGLVNGEWVVFESHVHFDQPVSTQRRHAALEGMLTSANLQFVGQTREIGSRFAFQATSRALEWSDRVTVSHRSMLTEGVALEYMIALANQVGAAPWFCVHHLASDDYVRQMAILVRDTLRPDVNVFVEHSNEVWNVLFPQGQYARRRGMELGLHQTGGSSNDCAHFASEDVCANIRYHTKRSLEIFAIFIEVFGVASRHARLRFVLATHTGFASAAYHTEQLTYLDAHQTVDLFGVTAYMAPDSVDGSFVQYSATQIHGIVEGAAPTLAERLRGIADVAGAHGVGLCVYEGGPALVEDGVIGGGQPTGDVTEGLIAANRHPGMGGVLDVVFNALEASGSGVLANASRPFMYFTGPTGTYSRYGSWGMQEFTDQPVDEAPKYRAVATRISQHKEAGGAVPATATCVAAAQLRGAAPLEDAFDASGAYVQRFGGMPAVTSPRLGDELVAGQQYAVTWHSDARRRNATERVTIELFQHHDCNTSGLVQAVASSVVNTGTISLVLNASLSGGTDFFVRISAVDRPSVNYSEPFAVVAEEDAPPAFGLYIERDVDLLSAYHRDCKKGQPWAIVPHFFIDSCVFSSVEGCRSYRTARAGSGTPSRWNNWGGSHAMATGASGQALGVLHGWGKPVTDCTLHIIGVRATMQLEGLTRGFDPTASEAVARVLSAEAQVPPGSVQFVNVRTVSGFATYYVSDCRRTDCAVGRRRRLQAASATSGTTALEFEVLVSSNDGVVSNVLTLLSDLSTEDTSNGPNDNATHTNHFAARLAAELSDGYGEQVSAMRQGRRSQRLSSPCSAYARRARARPFRSSACSPFAPLLLPSPTAPVPCAADERRRPSAQLEHRRPLRGHHPLRLAAAQPPTARAARAAGGRCGLPAAGSHHARRRGLRRGFR